MSQKGKTKRYFIIIGFFTIIASIICIFLILNYVSGKEADIQVVIWWIGLSLISIINYSLWFIAFSIYQKKTKKNEEYHKFRKTYPWLSLVYVSICAFRSFLPRAYVKRWVLVDSWWSNIFLARLGATFAEVCFIILIALYLSEVHRNIGLKIGITIAKIIVPSIIIAQVFSWLNVITTNNFFAIMEESIWGISGILLLIGTIPVYNKVENKYRKLVAVIIVLIFLYVIFMFTNDIPKYVMRFIADQRSGKEYLPISEGLNDLLTNYIVSYEFSDWQNEMLWLVLYFSFAVWISIYLIIAPIIKPNKKIEEKND